MCELLYCMSSRLPFPSLRSRWYALKARPGKKGDTKYRGEIECKVTFVVQSKPKGGSTEDLKRAGSIKNLANTVCEYC